MAKYHVYAGKFVHSRCRSELELITAAVVVDAATGTITRIDDLSSVGTAYSSADYQVHRLKVTIPRETASWVLALTAHCGSPACCLQDTQFMVPGFIDTHVHAPQVS